MPSDGSYSGQRSHFGRRGENAAISDKGSLPKFDKKRNPRDASESKRTAIMTLVAVGAGAFGVWAFFNAGSTDKNAHGKIYSSASKCASDGILSRQECQKQWNQSLKLHAAKAPFYSSQRECEIKHGAQMCTQPGDVGSPQRRSGFIPLMTGYVMGKLAQGGYQTAPLYKLRADEPHKHRMTASPPPVKDKEGRSISAFVWISRTARAASSPVAKRSLFASRNKAKSTSSSRSSARRGGFGRSFSRAGG